MLISLAYDKDIVDETDDSGESDDDDIPRVNDTEDSVISHSTSKSHIGENPNNSVDTVTVIAVSIGTFLFVILILCTVVIVAKRRKDRAKMECHDEGMLHHLINLRKLSNKIKPVKPKSVFQIIFMISGDESKDDHAGYDVAYEDVGIETMSLIEKSDAPSTFESVTTIDNVYYEASNEI